MAPRKIRFAHHVAPPRTPKRILRETRGTRRLLYGAASRGEVLHNFTRTDTLKTMFYVYVLRSDSAKFYIGYSANLRRRINEHRAKKVLTTKSGNYELIYYEAYKNKAGVVGRELFLKSGLGHRFLNKQLKHFLTESNERAGVV